MSDKKSRALSKFKKEILDHYIKGDSDSIEANELLARSQLPPGTAQARSFASLAFEYPKYHSDKCVACMQCVVQCPDAAIHARAISEAEVQTALAQVKGPELRAAIENRFVKNKKLWETNEKRGKTPALFSIWIDPDKCKGCGECEKACGDHDALKMTPKESMPMDHEEAGIEFLREHLPQTSQEFINEKLYVDLFMRDDHWAYRGGAGACKGCGEITSLKMALAATTSKYGKDLAIVAATGCNSVFSSTYPFNIFNVPWTNPLFENAPATALGVRMRLNQLGKENTKLWVFGGDGAMNDIGFQSLSRAVMTGEDINVLVMDTQVYSNTGGQASTATFTAQNAKMSAHGRAFAGKTERRKELGLILMSHPDVFVAQVSPGYPTHFLKTVLAGLEYKGPSVIIAYSPCMPEHGIADHASYEQSQAAVLSRAFPLFVHDPRKGDTLKQCLDLGGNPSSGEVWHKDPKTGELMDFVWFARKEERFAKLFDKEGKPSEALLRSQEDRAKNWNQLRELAGVLKTS